MGLALVRMVGLSVVVAGRIVLNRYLVCVVCLNVLVGCTGKSVVMPVRNKRYIACCDPGLSADDKDMCKWSRDNPGKIIVQGNSLYEMTWSDCKPGGEPWRKYE